MIESRPVVKNPDSVTHWTCPVVSDRTHFIGVAGKCVYCGKGITQLRAEQAALIKEGITMDGVSASNARQSKFYEQNPRVDARPGEVSETEETA